MKRKDFNALYVTCLTLSVASVISMGTLVVTIGYCDKLEKDFNRQSSVQEKEAEDWRLKYVSSEAAYENVLETLYTAEEQLNRFINPIEYNIDPAPLYDITLSDDLQQYTYDTCRYYHMEDYYETVLAVMYKESNFEADKISPTNDYGLMQINICNHKYLKDTLGLVDMLNEKDNIEAGVYLLSTLLGKYKQMDRALMVYNMGPANAEEQWGRGNYTSAYLHEVQEKEIYIRNKNK